MAQRGNARPLIKKAVLDILVEGDRLTVQNIVQRTGINRSTYYYHYREPQEVVNDILAEFSDSFKEVFTRGLPIDLEDVDEERPNSLISALCEFMYANRDCIRSFCCNSEYDLVFEIALRNAIKEVIADCVIVGKLEDGSEKRFFEGASFDYLSNQVMYQTLGIVKLWAARGFEKDEAKMRDLIADLANYKLVRLERLANDRGGAKRSVGFSLPC